MLLLEVLLNVVKLFKSILILYCRYFLNKSIFKIYLISEKILYIYSFFMVVVAQLVRAPDCGSGSRRFEPDLPPLRDSGESLFLYGLTNCILQKSEYKFKNDLHLNIRNIDQFWHVFGTLF